MRLFLLLMRVSCLLLPLVPIGARGAYAACQPDLLVRAEGGSDSSYLGGGVFETTVVTQSLSQPSVAGGTVLYRVTLKNAGDIADSFLVTSTGSGTGYTVRYLDLTGVDRSAEITGAGLTAGPLAPGDFVSFILQVTPTVIAAGASYRTTVTAASLTDPAKIDQLKTETVLCGSSAAVTISAPADSSAAPGSVVNYAYTVTNVGNTANSFTLGVAGSWPGAIIADDGSGGGIAGDGVRQSGENQVTAGTGTLAPAASYRFFLAVTVPAAATDGLRADATVTVSGPGAAASDQVTTTALAPVVSVAEDVRNITQGGAFAATGSAQPGDVLEYRMTVTNSGSAPAAALAVDAPLPANTTALPATFWVGTSAAGDGSACQQQLCGYARESSGTLLARLGQGAGDAGGLLQPGKTLYVYYRVQVQ